MAEIKGNNDDSLTTGRVSLDRAGLIIDGHLAIPALALAPDIKVENRGMQGADEYAITLTFHAKAFDMQVAPGVRVDISNRGA